MSPINGLSETIRMPRLGKIRLGIKAISAKTGKAYPEKTEYFVLPKDHPNYNEMVKAFGEKPKELRVLIPSENEDTWAEQYFKAYSLSRGLICKGEGGGAQALRMVDTKTGALANEKTETVTLKEVECKGRECNEYISKKCHERMNLRFLLPDIPGLGVWQIDTGSINSILNINSCADIIKRAFKQIHNIPLILSLEPIQVNNPETGKKQTAYVLNLRTNVTLVQLAEQARQQTKTFMIEAPDLEEVYEEQLQKEIDDLFDPATDSQQKVTVQHPKHPANAGKVIDVQKKPASEVQEGAFQEVKAPEATKQASTPLDLGALYTWILAQLKDKRILPQNYLINSLGADEADIKNKDVAKLYTLVQKFHPEWGEYTPEPKG